ncbi:MAG TPA: HlyD family secretion protein, partial [Ohtaekwangia sp.]
MENTTASTPKSKRPLFIVLAVVAIGGFFGIKKFLHNRAYESTDNAQIESRSVPVISRVAGYIDSISIDDYGKAKENDILIKIDDKEYALAVVQAHADLLNAQADLANAQASLRNAQANRKLASANADVQQTRLTKAKTDLNRDDALFKDNAITQKQADDTRSAYDAASKQYTANLEQVNLAATQVATA